jgi:hypothetical protein
VRVQWVHPSWRDLVIDHLVEDQAARRRFLSGCGVHGVLLALSFAGGERGERALPLMSGDSDWDALTDRVYELAPELEATELQAVLESVGQAITALDESGAHAEAIALAGTVLTRLTSLWDATKDPIPLQALDGWLTLAGRLPRDAPRPAPPYLVRTWAELLPAGAPSLEDRDGVERFADWLTLAELLHVNFPEALGRLQFLDDLHLVDGFLGEVESHPDKIHPAAHEHVQRALGLIETLAPRRSNLAHYFFARLGAARARIPEMPSASTEPLAAEAWGWRLFDVARVLDDL